MTEQPEPLRLADVLDHVELRPSDYKDVDKAAAELRRLHAENEMLWKEREEPHQKVAMYVRECNRLEDERDELRKVNAELLEALDKIAINTHDDTAERVARAAIAKAEGGQG